MGVFADLLGAAAVHAQLLVGERGSAFDVKLDSALVEKEVLRGIRLGAEVAEHYYTSLGSGQVGCGKNGDGGAPAKYCDNWSTFQFQYGSEQVTAAQRRQKVDAVKQLAEVAVIEWRKNDRENVNHASYPTDLDGSAKHKKALYWSGRRALAQRLASGAGKDPNFISGPGCLYMPAEQQAEILELLKVRSPQAQLGAFINGMEVNVSLMPTKDSRQSGSLNSLVSTAPNSPQPQAMPMPALESPVDDEGKGKGKEFLPPSVVASQTMQHREAKAPKKLWQRQGHAQTQGLVASTSSEEPVAVGHQGVVELGKPIQDWATAAANVASRQGLPEATAAPAPKRQRVKQASSDSKKGNRSTVDDTKNVSEAILQRYRHNLAQAGLGFTAPPVGAAAPTAAPAAAGASSSGSNGNGVDMLAVLAAEAIKLDTDSSPESDAIRTSQHRPLPPKLKMKSQEELGSFRSGSGSSSSYTSTQRKTT